jgi:single-strand DNA-binding protein
MDVRPFSGDFSMSGIQQLTLIGNLVRDPEEKTSASGVILTRFTIPVSEKRNGEEKTTWFNCVAFGKTAEFISKYFEKGKPIYVIGRVEVNMWETKEGEKRADLQVVVDRAQFVPGVWGEGLGREPGSDDDASPAGDARSEPRQTAKGQANLIDNAKKAGDAPW